MRAAYAFDTSPPESTFVACRWNRTKSRAEKKFTSISIELPNFMCRQNWFRFHSHNISWDYTCESHLHLSFPLISHTQNFRRSLCASFLSTLNPFLPASSNMGRWKLINFSFLFFSLLCAAVVCDVVFGVAEPFPCQWLHKITLREALKLKS